MMPVLVSHDHDGTSKRSWAVANSDTLTSGSRFNDDVSSKSFQEPAKKQKQSKSKVNYGCHFYYHFITRIFSII